MSTHTVKKIDEMEAVYLGAFKRARAELGVESFGMSIIDLPPNFENYPEHDHAQGWPGGGLRGAARGWRDRDRRRALPARFRPHRPRRLRHHAQGLAGSGRDPTPRPWEAFPAGNTWPDNSKLGEPDPMAS